MSDAPTAQFVVESGPTPASFDDWVEPQVSAYYVGLLGAGARDLHRRMTEAMVELVQDHFVKLVAHAIESTPLRGGDDFVVPGVSPLPWARAMGWSFRIRFDDGARLFIGPSKLKPLAWHATRYPRQER